MTDKRDNKGRFMVGSKGGPGRPPSQTEREYLEATLAACSVADWARIVKKAVEDCEHEDHKVRASARNFLLRALHGNSPSVLLQYAQILIEENKANKPDSHLRGISEETQRLIDEILGAV